jgi:hypothetical protein
MIFPQLPGPTELAPYLQKMEAAPGSVILIAIEQPGTCNFARCTAAWLSRGEAPDFEIHAREKYERDARFCARKPM